MLRDVEDFINALPLTVTPLANTAFSAFISYRHGDIDSRAAQELQKSSLSIFVRPRVSPQKGNRSKDAIWMMASCPAAMTMQNSFVRRLKTRVADRCLLTRNKRLPLGKRRNRHFSWEYHDRSRVLALLTGGEPEQSFPPRLLEETPAGDLLIAADCREMISDRF